MAKASDGDQTLPPQEQLFRDMGFGRTKLRLVYGTMLVLACANVAQGIERYQLGQRTQTQAFVVVTDSAGHVAQIQRANSAWQPADGVWINTAITWIRHVRARPADPDTFRWQAAQVRKTTTRELWAPLNTWMVQTRKELHGRAVDFELLEATLVQGGTSAATVYVRWRERKRLGSTTGAWSNFAATLTVAKIAPETPKEVADNPLGLYVVDYSFAREAT